MILGVYAYLVIITIFIEKLYEPILVKRAAYKCKAATSGSAKCACISKPQQLPSTYG